MYKVAYTLEYMDLVHLTTSSSNTPNFEVLSIVGFVAWRVSSYFHGNFLLFIASAGSSNLELNCLTPSCNH